MACLMIRPGSFSQVELGDSNPRPPACKIRGDCRLLSLTWGCGSEASAGIGSRRVLLWSALVVSSSASAVGATSPKQDPGGLGVQRAPAIAAATAAGWERNGECDVSRPTTVVGVLDKALISLMKRCCRAGLTVLSFAVVM
jgi:hypothetical protein